MKYPIITNAVSTLLLSTLLVAGHPGQAQTGSQSIATKVSTTTQSEIMNNQPAQVVKTFLTAIQEGDHKTPKELIHPDIKWNQPGTNRFAGLKPSAIAVIQMFGGMIEASAQTLRLADIKQLTVNGNRVACLVRWKAVQPGGGVLDVHNIDVYTVENGKITEATIYSEDTAQEDAFWGK